MAKTLNNTVTVPVVAILIVLAGIAGIFIGSARTTPLTVTVTDTRSVANTSSGFPIAVVSVAGPAPPFTPGGPTVVIALKNVGESPVVSLAAYLTVPWPKIGPYNFTFNVNESNPLEPGQSANSTPVLIDGSIGNGSYPLTVDAIMQGGTSFSFTEDVQIASPYQATTSASVSQRSFNYTSMPSTFTIGGYAVTVGQGTDYYMKMGNGTSYDYLGFYTVFSITLGNQTQEVPFFWNTPYGPSASHPPYNATCYAKGHMVTECPTSASAFDGSVSIVWSLQNSTIYVTFAVSDG